MKRSIYGRSFYSHEVTIKQSFPFVPTRWASTVLVFQWTKITPIMAENKNKWVFIGVRNLYSWSYGPLLTTDFWFVRWPPPKQTKPEPPPFSSRCEWWPKNTSTQGDLRPAKVRVPSSKGLLGEKKIPLVVEGFSAGEEIHTQAQLCGPSYPEEEGWQLLTLTGCQPMEAFYVKTS